MGITLKTRKMLWGRSANRCSFPECRSVLVEDETETDDPSIIGDEAHIVAREINGPRGNSDLPIEARDNYNNLVLLCKIHHKIIDDQTNKYTVEFLTKMKEEHIEWVNKNLDIDKFKQRDDEIFASYIDRWIELGNVNEWNSWSSFVLEGGQPHILEKQFINLKKLNDYIFNRIWPDRYDRIKHAFTNFRLVLTDLINTFEKYAEKLGDGDEAWLWTKKFYKIEEWNPKLYHELGKKFDYHVDLVEDLMLELTRAGNYLCDQIRKYFQPSFRLSEGALTVTSGPHIDFSFKTYRVEYSKEETNNMPYPGLRSFMEIRIERDYHFGKGISEYYFPPKL